MEEAVLAYREEYIIERGFNSFRGQKLCMTPLFLNSTTRIKGLIRLLSIGLRVLCVVEFKVREALQEKNEKLDKIYTLRATIFGFRQAGIESTFPKSQFKK